MKESKIKMISTSVAKGGVLSMHVTTILFKNDVILSYDHINRTWSRIDDSIPSDLRNIAFNDD